MHRHHEKAKTHVPPEYPARRGLLSLFAGKLSVAAMMAPDHAPDQACATLDSPRSLAQSRRQNGGAP
jgi:hypothetical protein